MSSDARTSGVSGGVPSMTGCYSSALGRCCGVGAALALVLCVYPVLLAGCTSRPTGDLYRPASVEADEGIVYIYRPSEPFGGPAVVVRLDQTVVGELDAGEYLAVPVPPGETLINAEGRGSAARMVIVLRGRASFVEIRASGLNDFVAIDLPTAAQAEPVIAETVSAG